MLQIPILALLTGGCAFDPCNPGHGIEVDCDPSDNLLSADVGGGGTSFPLPFAEGEMLRCTQGVHGSYSHTGTSTRYGLDLDTPNDADMELYAPVGGLVSVHTESATSGFGYHVAIAVAEGEYLLIAHFGEIFVEDGQEVAAGQLLGYDGCTGACSGDHAHMGLMEGDPSEMAQFGRSVDMMVRTADMDQDEPAFGDVAASDFTCDTSSGHVYASDLKVAAWHPDGTLVMAPNDPKVYLVEDGRARHVANETVFWSHNWDFDDVALVSDEEIACYGEGEPIESEGSVRAGYDEDGGAWLLVTDEHGSSWKQRLPPRGAEEVAESWGLYGDLGMDAIVTDETLDGHLTRLGTAPFRDGSVLKETGRSDVYVVSNGVALPVKDWSAYLLLGFGGRDILELDDGLVDEVMGDNVGSCSAGIWCLDAEAVVACGGGLEIGSGESGGEEYGEVEEEDDEEDREDVEDGEDADTAIEEETVDTGVEEGENGQEEEREEEDSVGEEEVEDETDEYLWIDGGLVCFSAGGFAFPYDAADAFMVGYGGTSPSLDFTFQEDFRLSESGGAYCLDTSALDFDDYEVTLVSSLDSSGGPATSYADTGDWWDNYDFCTGGSDAALQFCASQGGWDYLVAFTVTTGGPQPNGDGA